MMMMMMMMMMMIVFYWLWLCLWLCLWLWLWLLWLLWLLLSSSSSQSPLEFDQGPELCGWWFGPNVGGDQVHWVAWKGKDGRMEGWKVAPPKSNSRRLFKIDGWKLEGHNFPFEMVRSSDAQQFLHFWKMFDADVLWG